MLVLWNKWDAVSPGQTPGAVWGPKGPPDCWWCSSGCVPKGCFPHVVWCAELNPYLFTCGTASGSCAGAHVEMGFYWHGAEQDAAPGCRMRLSCMSHYPRSPCCGCGWGPSSATAGLWFISSAGLWCSRLCFLLLQCDARGGHGREGARAVPAATLPLAARHLPAPGWVQPPGGREVQRGHSIGLLVMGDWGGGLGSEGS